MNSIKLEDIHDCEIQKMIFSHEVPTEIALCKTFEKQIQLIQKPSLSESISALGETPFERNISTRMQAQYQASSHCPLIHLQYQIIDSIDRQKYYRQRRLVLRKAQLSSNDTKNIAKNYGKAIIGFIHKEKNIFRTICKLTSTPYERIIQQLPQIKAILTTVVGFRKVWCHYKYAQCMRMVSGIFLRKKSLDYIFNSKVVNIQNHLKYRSKFLEALQDPIMFNHIKDK